MPISVINGLRLYAESSGDHGGQVVLVHGSWGDQSPPFFGAILDRLAAALPQAQRSTFRGAGHIPHVTRPDEFVSIVGGFVGSVAATRPVPTR